MTKQPKCKTWYKIDVAMHLPSFSGQNEVKRLTVPCLAVLNDVLEMLPESSIRNTMSLFGFPMNYQKMHTFISFRASYIVVFQYIWSNWAVGFPRITPLSQTLGNPTNLKFFWKKESEKEYTMVLEPKLKYKIFNCFEIICYCAWGGYRALFHPFICRATLLL